MKMTLLTEMLLVIILKLYASRVASTVQVFVGLNGQYS